MGMNKEHRINAIYKIFALREQIDSAESDVTIEGYLKYLERMYVWFLGYGNEEIYSSIKGLQELGLNASKSTVKSVVFRIIAVLDKGG